MIQKAQIPLEFCLELAFHDKYQPVNLHGRLRKEVKLPFGHTLIRRRFNLI